MRLAQITILNLYEKWRNTDTLIPLCVELEGICGLEKEREWYALLDWCRLEKHLACRLNIVEGTLTFVHPATTFIES